MTHESFASRYRAILERNGSSLCIGLDMDWRQVPDAARSAANPVLEFNRQIIDATSDLCAAYKPNLAFYESYGTRGLEALEETLKLVPDGVLTIGDAKRGDIGNTAERYAYTMLDLLGFDAVTVNPYMGLDTMESYFAYPGKCVFVLALTSNPGSSDFETLVADGKPVYMHVIDRCMERYASTGQLGFVVGATHPDDLAAIRGHVGPEIPLLVPGLGTQGGELEKTVRANDGGIAFYNVARAIIKAGDGEDFAARARVAAQGFADQLNAAVAAG
jgi:orotidine-5'-phosphate decarboxylase